jgi:hypothetical protein
MKIKRYENFVNENLELDSIRKRIDVLEDLIDSVREKFDKTWFSGENPARDFLSAEGDYNKYLEERDKPIKKEVKELSELESKLRMLMEPEFKPMPTYGDKMSLAEFIDNVKHGGFIDYDGFGNYTKDGKMSNIEIYPSDVKKGNIRKDFDSIIWFNR